jgi:hypothetical protein
MIDTTAKTTELDPIKLKNLKKEINSELSRAVANSQISQILRKYGITDPNYLEIRCSLSPHKSRVSEFAKTLGLSIENYFIDGENIEEESFPCPALSQTSAIECDTPTSCSQVCRRTGQSRI